MRKEDNNLHLFLFHLLNNMEKMLIMTAKLPGIILLAFEAGDLDPVKPTR